MGLFGKIFKKEKHYIPKLLEEIWNTETFKNGLDSFHFGNFPLFRLINETELKISNDLKNHDFDLARSDFGDKTIIGISDTNMDREHDAYLLCDENKVIYGYHFNSKQRIKPIRISESLEALFEEYQILNELIARDDDDYWTWNEINFHSSEFVTPPKGVFPKEDLRSIIAVNDSIFLSDHENFSLTGFRSFFKNQQTEIEIPNDFSAFRIEDENLIELIKSINGGKQNYAIGELHPSGNWVVINLLTIKKSVLEKLTAFGLTVKNFA